MVDRDDRKLEEEGRTSIGRRLAATGRAAGRLLIAAWVEPVLSVIRVVHTWVKRAEPWGILIVVIAFTLDFRDRVGERTVRAWQLLTTSAPGNSGKKEALEYLNGQDGLCWGDRCLLTLKGPTSLMGIDLSPPDRGTLGNPDDDGPGAFLLGAQLIGANLQKANLMRADLTSARLRWALLDDANLHGADLTFVDLQGAFLRFADLEQSTLVGANLTNANLLAARLVKAHLHSANLIGIDLQGANLREADLRNVDLRGANLARAYVGGAFLHDANLTGASLEDANLSTAIGLTQDQLNSALGDEDTRIPEGLTRPEHW